MGEPAGAEPLPELPRAPDEEEEDVDDEEEDEEDEEDGAEMVGGDEVAGTGTTFAEPTARSIRIAAVPALLLVSGSMPVSELDAVLRTRPRYSTSGPVRSARHSR